MLVLIAAIVVLVTIWIIYDTTPPKGLPKGVRGLPFIGKIPHTKQHLVHQIESYRKKYGDVFSWRMGSRNIVFVCDFKLIKEAFSSPYISDRADFHSFLAFSWGKPVGIGNASGESWQNVRRFSIKLLRDRGMGKSSFEPQIDQEVAYVIEDFKQHTNEVDELPWSLNVAILNVTWRILADSRYDIQDPKMQELQKTMRDFFDGFQGNVQLMDFFPFLINITPKFISKKLGIQDYYDACEKTQTFIQKIIRDYQAQDDLHKQENFIGAYLKEMEKYERGEHSDYANTFNWEDLTVALGDMFSAASESTSSTTRWIMHYMAHYPEIQKKVQAEIDSVCPRDKRPCLDDRVNLPYTNAVIYEVMRCMPVTPILLHHYSSAEVQFGEHTIPKGTIVIGSALHCHKDPKYWERPMDFYPEHFLDSEGKFDGKKQAFIPFSIGRRVCIGESIAKMILFLISAALLQNFTFASPKGKTLSLELDPKQSLLSLPFDSILTYSLRE